MWFLIGIHHSRPLQKRKLVCALAHFHSASRIADGPVEILTTTKQMFDEHRTSLCDPTKAVIPWKTRIVDPEVDKWKRNVKPNGREYPMLKDEASFPRFTEKFYTTLEAHDLRHLITPGRTITNPEVEDVQQKWLYKVFQDIMVAPAAKAIVIKHLTNKNTTDIWEEIKTHCGNSMTAELQSQKISTHCTSVRFKSLNWRGGQQSFLLHFADQLRMCDVISRDNYSEGQRINFLHAAVSGVPNLENVLTLRNTAKKAAGVQQSETHLKNALPHFLSKLKCMIVRTPHLVVHAPTVKSTHINLCLMTLTPKTSLKNVRPILITLILIMSWNMIRKPTLTLSFVILWTHDKQVVQVVDTARVNLSTWKSLTSEDQTAWDAVTDDGKTKILRLCLQSAAIARKKTDSLFSLS